MGRIAAMAGGSAVTSVVAAVGWPGLVLAAIVIVSVVLAICWVINDADRAARLCDVIREWRRGSSPRRRR